MSAKEKQKGGLGRGVGALLSDDLSMDNEDKYFFCDIDKIIPNPQQPRKHFDQEQLQHLANSIREKGVLQPLLVTRSSNNRYILVAGERRLRASRMAGLVEVPVVVKEEGSPTESLELALIENVVRHDLNPIEEANAYFRLIEEFHLTQEEVAHKVGRQRSTITNTLRLLHLPGEIQHDVVTNAISEGHARVLLRLKDAPDKMLEVRGRIIKEKLSVRQTEKACQQQLVKNAASPIKRIPAKEKELFPDSYSQAVTTQLTNILNTRVRLVTSGNRGKIEIEYYSPADLDRLVSLLSAAEK